MNKEEYILSLTEKEISFLYTLFTSFVWSNDREQILDVGFTSEELDEIEYKLNKDTYSSFLGDLEEDYYTLHED